MEYGTTIPYLAKGEKDVAIEEENIDVVDFALFEKLKQVVAEHLIQNGSMLSSKITLALVELLGSMLNCIQDEDDRNEEVKYTRTIVNEMFDDIQTGQYDEDLKDTPPTSDLQ